MLFRSGCLRNYILEYFGEKTFGPCDNCGALLCDFSAPVKLDYDYTTEQLLGLLKFADNQFARWDAAQMLFTQELRRNVAHFQQGEAFDISSDVLTALSYVLENYEQDIELATLILTLPKDIEFAESFKTIDPDGIAAAREFMLDRKSVV